MSRLAAINTALVLLAIAMTTGACKRQAAVPDPQPGVYYWRTTLSLDSAELRFLADHRIGKMYVRYFDVALRDGRPMPNATLQFNEPIPAGVEIIPTVFIMENCITTDSDAIQMADLLVKRVLQMNETNDVPGVKELQIDCDWTERSQRAYFALLRQARQLLRDHGMRLSATIRLHQLRMTPPPVDYGVLMVYNTGLVSAMNGRNPILDARDVEPYLDDVGGYDLPLCAAYPDFGWQVLSGTQGFKAILYEEDLADSSVYRQVDSTHWVAISSRDIPTLSDDGSQTTWVLTGDSVTLYLPAAELIVGTARALQQRRPGINSQVVLYNLNSSNIKLYYSNHYETLFHLH